MYEISTMPPPTSSPPRALIASMSAQGNVSSMPKRMPIFFLRMKAIV